VTDPIDTECFACDHERHDEEVCCVLVRAGEHERACGCLEG
jgi:hypothetical protein